MLALCLGPAAFADAVIEVVPEHDGLFQVDEVVHVDFFVTGDESQNIRVMQLDFTSSDSLLDLGSVFDFDYTGANGVYIDIFSYLEFNSLIDADGRVVNTTWVGFSDLGPDFLLDFAPGVPVHVGSLELRTPVIPGSYILDSLSVGSPWGGSVIGDWSAADGTLTGGQYTFLVIPEPASAVLAAALGMVVLARTRRKEA